MDPNILIGAALPAVAALGGVFLGVRKLRRDLANDRASESALKAGENAALVNANAEAWNKLAKQQEALIEANDKRVDLIQQQVVDCQRDRERLQMELLEERSERRMAVGELKRELESVSVRIPERRTDDKGRGARKDGSEEERAR